MSLRDLGQKMRARRLASLRKQAQVQGSQEASEAKAKPEKLKTSADPKLKQAATHSPLSKAQLDELESICASISKFGASIRALSPEQQAAILTPNPATLLEAQVGSGKTTVLIHRVIFWKFKQQIPWGRIHILTFTNRAANEIRERLRAWFPDGSANATFVGTFHSQARALINSMLPNEKSDWREGFEVLTPEDQKEILDQLIENNKLKIGFRTRLMRRFENFKKSGQVLFGSMKHEDDLKKLVTLYEETKRENNHMDFDDLIPEATRLLKEAEDRSTKAPQMLAIDELQDCNAKQLELLKAWRNQDTAIFLVGDRRQVIYSWRGSHRSVFDDCIDQFQCKTMTLSRNYRSDLGILEAAVSILTHQGVEIEATRPSRVPIPLHHFLDPFNESAYWASRISEFKENGQEWADHAILLRTQEQVELTRKVFKDLGIPCAEVRARKLKNDEEADTMRQGVLVMTMHASKGLEFASVFIGGLNQGLMPLSGQGRNHEEEERRLLYVAMTRAKSHLELSYLTQPGLRGAKPTLSPFLSSVPMDLIEWNPKIEGTKSKQEENQSKGEGEAEAGFKVGDKVSHPRYGEGKIIEVTTDKLSCDFGSMGTKSFARSLCPLTLIIEESSI